MPAGGARGFRVSATQQQSDSLAVPRIDARPYVAEAEAAGAIGDGVQKLGDGMQRLAVARFDAINKRRAAEADIVFDKASGDLAVELANEKDTNKWDAIADKHTKGIADVVNDPTLSIDARDEIERRYNRWSTRTIGEVKLSGAVREGQLAGETIRGAFMVALRNRDVGRATELWNSAEGVLGPVARASMQVDLENSQETWEKESVTSDVNGLMAPGVADLPAAKKRVAESNLRPEEKVNLTAQLDHQHGVGQQQEEFEALAAEDPDAAEKAARDKTAFPFLTDRTDMVNKARIYKVAKANSAFKEAKEAIDLGGFGGLNNADDLNGPDFVDLTPHQKFELGGYLQKRLDVQQMNRGEKYLEMLTSIEGLVDDGTGLPKADLVTTIETNFDGARKAELLKRVEDRTSKAGKTPGVLTGVFGILDDWAMKDQKFGPYKKQAIGKDGNPLFKTEKQLTIGDNAWSMDRVERDVDVPVMEEDPVMRDKVTNQVLKVKDDLQAEFEAGNIKTHEAAMLKLGELTRFTISEAAATAHAPKVGPRMSHTAPGASTTGDASLHGTIPTVSGEAVGGEGDTNPILIMPDEPMDPALKAIIERNK